MSELVVTCAGCGKRYKGSVTGKKFKCGECHNLYTFPDGPRTPGENKTCCTHCWTEIDLADNPDACPDCGQRVSAAVCGKATPPAAASSGHGQPNPEMQNQLAMLARERDELIEIRRKQDRTLADLLGQLAFAKSQDTKTPSEDAAQWELQMEIGELKTRVSSLEEDKKRLAAERDAAMNSALNNAEMKIRLAEMEHQLAAAPATPPAEPAAPPPPPEPLVDDQALKEAAEGRRALEMRVAELEQQLSALEEAQAVAERERGSAVLRADKAEADLEHFREAAVQALLPLGQECSRSMKQIQSEADTMIENLRKQVHDSNRVIEEQLQNCGAKITEQIKTSRHELIERFATVLGTPQESGAVHKAVAENPPAPASSAAPTEQTQPAEQAQPAAESAA